MVTDGTHEVYITCFQNEVYLTWLCYFFSTQVTVWRKLTTVTWQRQSYLERHPHACECHALDPRIGDEGKLAICDSSNKHTSVLRVWVLKAFISTGPSDQVVEEHDKLFLLHWNNGAYPWAGQQVSHISYNKMSQQSQKHLSSAQMKWTDHRNPAHSKMPVRYMRLSTQARTASEETAERCLK